MECIESTYKSETVSDLGIVVFDPSTYNTQCSLFDSQVFNMIGHGMTLGPRLPRGRPINNVFAKDNRPQAILKGTEISIYY